MSEEIKPNTPHELTNTKHQFTPPSLDKSILLEEAKPPHQSSFNILIISSILGGFIFWSYLTPINEVSVAVGQVIPTGFIKSVQHLEGGIVSQLYVREGMWVNQGDFLMLLDGQGAMSELEQAISKQTSLRIKAERLRAVGLGYYPAFNTYDSRYGKLIQDQKAIYDMQMRNTQDQLAVIAKQIDQEKSTVNTMMGQEKDLRERLSVVEKQRDVLKDLYEKRLKTGTEYRNAEENVSVVLKQLHETVNQMQKSKGSIAEHENKATEIGTHQRTEALNEMGATESELGVVTETITKLKDRVSRLEIRASNAGIVKGLKITNVRAVIQPGEEIMQIVPANAFEVEAKLSPRDVGNVRQNQPVSIKVDAYDYNRFGAIDGKVKYISASTFVTEDKKPYFKVFISLSHYYVGANQRQNLLSPGMTVTADIQTGAKTLLQYLIKPVYNAYHTAFRER